MAKRFPMLLGLLAMFMLGLYLGGISQPQTAHAASISPMASQATGNVCTDPIDARSYDSSIVQQANVAQSDALEEYAFLRNFSGAPQLNANLYGHIHDYTVTVDQQWVNVETFLYNIHYC